MTEEINDADKALDALLKTQSAAFKAEIQREVEAEEEGEEVWRFFPHGDEGNAKVAAFILANPQHKVVVEILRHLQKYEIAKSRLPEVESILASYQEARDVARRSLKPGMTLPSSFDDNVRAFYYRTEAVKTTMELARRMMTHLLPLIYLEMAKAES